MKVLNILLVFSVCLTVAMAGEVTVNLDRVALLNPAPNQENDSGNRLAIHFSIPEEVASSNIVYAELTIPIDLSQVNYEGDDILEIQARDITDDWTEEDANCFSDLDSNSFYSYTINMQNDRAMYMDITEFVHNQVDGELDNFGLMLVPFKYDQQVFNLPRAVISLIRNSARIKIIYE